MWSVDDSFESHIEDTMRAGAGLCHRDVVETIVRDGPEAVRELIALGTQFTRIARGRRGRIRPRPRGRPQPSPHPPRPGPDRPRDHARARRGGRGASRNIRVLEEQLAVDLLVERNRAAQPPAMLGRVRARPAQSAPSGSSSRAPRCWRPAAPARSISTPPIRTSPPATASRWRTAPACRSPTWSSSSSIRPASTTRGEVVPDHRGAARRGRDSAAARRHAVHEALPPDAELAPRDIVARAIDYEMKRHGSTASTSTSAIATPTSSASAFPNIYERCLNFGIDITRAADPGGAGGALHVRRRGDRPRRRAPRFARLYAAGEVAMTGLHGANRLASNSLLEAAVLGRRAFAAARRADDRGRDRRPPEFPEWDPGRAVKSEERVVVTQNWDEMRRLMWNYVGIVRSDRRLERALQPHRAVAGRDSRLLLGPPARLGPDRAAQPGHGGRADRRLGRSAARRSRGLHYNIDYPDTDDAHWLHDTIIRS